MFNFHYYSEVGAISALSEPSPLALAY